MYLRMAGVALLLALGFVAGLRWDAVKVQAVEKDFAAYRADQAQQILRQQARRAQERAREAEQQRQEGIAHEHRLAALQRDNDRLADRVRTEPSRVCQARPGRAVVPATAPAPGGGPDPAAVGELQPAAGVHLVRLARDADRIREALIACLAGYPSAEEK